MTNDEAKGQAIPPEAWDEVWSAIGYYPTETISAAIGRHLRELRDRDGLLGEDIARMAREVGLPWNQATIAAIETGRREIALGELVALSTALNRKLFSWFPSSGEIQLLREDDKVGERLWGDVGPPTISRSALRFLLGSKVEDYPVPGPSPSDVLKRWGAANEDDLVEAVMGGIIKRTVQSFIPGYDEETAQRAVKSPRDAVMDSDNKAEVKAAKRLGMRPVDLSLLAHIKWGHGLSAERDARVRQELGLDAPQRTVQAKRGHVTRTLIDELAAWIAAHQRPGGGP